MNEKLITIKNIAQELLSKMGFQEAAVEILNDLEGMVVCINAPEGGLLIGQGGEALFSLQQLIRMMVFKEFKGEMINFSLDINDYRRHQIEILKDFAIEKANRVAQEKRSFSFQPMSAYERRIVHLVLKERQGVVCESEGMGRERHIVIWPA